MVREGQRAERDLAGKGIEIGRPIINQQSAAAVMGADQCGHSFHRRGRLAGPLVIERIIPQLIEYQRRDEHDPAPLLMAKHQPCRHRDGNQHRQDIVDEEIGYREEADRRKDQPADQEPACSRVLFLLDAQDCQADHEDRPHNQCPRPVPGHLRIEMALVEVGGDHGVPIFIPMADRRIIAGNRRRRRHADCAKGQGSHSDTRRGHAGPPQRNQHISAKEQRFKDCGLFDRRGQRAQRHGGPDSPAGAATLQRIEFQHHQQSCPGNQQIVEHRALPANPAQWADHDQIGDPGEDRALAVIQYQNDPPDHPGGGCGKQARGDLIGQHRGRDRGDTVVDQEQTQRLAIPDIDIGQRAFVHPLAHQKIELIVDEQIGIAKGPGAQAKGGGEHNQRGQQRRAQPARLIRHLLCCHACFPYVPDQIRVRLNPVIV